MKRRILFITVLGILVLFLSACASVFAERPSESGQIEIVMTDYAFSPDVIRLEAGQTVSIVLRNNGDKLHEFMAGRNVLVHENFTEGFEEDFFDGIDLEITGPGMVMGLPGMEMEGMDMGGEMDMADDHDEEEAGMDDMDMAGDHDDEEAGMEEMDMADDHDEEKAGMEDMDMAADHEEDESGMEDMDMADDHDDEEASMEDMDMADDHDETEAGMADMAMSDEHQDEDEHDEGADAGVFGPYQLPEMDAHAGVMVMIDPVQAEMMTGEVTVITFTVPEDKIGTWEFGCFQERGQHYDDGMHGTIIVEG